MYSVSMLTSALTDQYGLKVPIVEAGMAFLGMPPLAIAVSKAGGMGTLGAAMVPPEGLRAMIRAVRAETDRPFGVNFITQFTTSEAVDVCIEEQVSVVSFHWDDPPVEYIKRLRGQGVKVWMQAGSIAMAKQLAEIGIDAVIAQGIEAGGHNRGTASTLVLVPAMVDAVAPIPVLAAGGIADGRGLVAALMLGAAGVWVGTRLAATHEAHAHPQYKQRIVDAGVGDTTLTRIFGPEWYDVTPLSAQPHRQGMGGQAAAATARSPGTDDRPYPARWAGRPDGQVCCALADPRHRRRLRRDVHGRRREQRARSRGRAGRRRDQDNGRGGRSTHPEVGWSKITPQAIRRRS